PPFSMFRQVFMVFFGKCRADHHTQEHLHESPKVMTLPLVVLAIGAVFAGYVGLPTVFGGSQFARWLEPVIAAHGEEHASHALEVGLMAVSITFAAFGFFVAYLMYYSAALPPGRFAGLDVEFFYRLFCHQ